jgi:hypothetical protein
MHLFGHRSFLLAKTAENGTTEGVGAGATHSTFASTAHRFRQVSVELCTRPDFATLTLDKSAMLRALCPGRPSLCPATLNKPDGGKR